MAHSIYLDNNTTTRPSEQAIAKMLPFLTERWGTPAAPYLLGQQLFPAIEESLRGIYALLGARESDDFTFTSSGAEGVNQAILSTYFESTLHKGKNQFVTSNIDEAAAIMSIGRLEQLGCVGKMALADKSGRITAQAISEAINPRTALVSLSWANGLTGAINPVDEIAALCKERGIQLHLDATHVLGKIFFDWEELPAHFISFNGDNLHAPKGTGGLFIRADTKCSPLIVGGSEQSGHRAGGLNVPALVALGEAAREAIDSRDLICTETARLRDKLEMGLIDAIPDAEVFFRDQERVPNCSAIAFSGIANEALLYLLNRRGVYASIGGGASQQIGLVLAASGVKEAIAHSAISFALSRETTEDEIDRTIEIASDCVKRLRKVSYQFTQKK